MMQRSQLRALVQEHQPQQPSWALDRGIFGLPQNPGHCNRQAEVRRMRRGRTRGWEGNRAGRGAVNQRGGGQVMWMDSSVAMQAPFIWGD